MLLFITFSLIFLFFTLAVCNFFATDQLLRLEFKKHRSEWEKDGRPYGYFWYPKGTAFWSGGLARGSVLYKWHKETPEWIKSDLRAVKLLYLYRWSLRLSLFLWLIIVIYMITFYRVEK